MSLTAYRNTILSRLSTNGLTRLQLRRVELERRHVIESPGNEMRHLYFLEAGIGSMTNRFLDGSEVEVGMYGWESVMCVSVLMGTRHSLRNVYMQLAGWGYSTRADLAREEFRRGGLFHDLVLRYSQALLVQATQTAACNARHRLDQRLARWLLLCHDRAGTDVMDITQEFLATMLGVERPAVSVEAGKLQDRGVIGYHRGRVRVLDREGLERSACECYAVVSHHLNSYAVEEQAVG